MKFFFILTCSMLFSHEIMAQNAFKARVINDKTKAALRSATAFIPDLKISAIADTGGMFTILNIPMEDLKSRSAT